MDNFKGSSDNFIYTIAPTSTNIVWATHIGGTDDEGFYNGVGGGFIDINKQNVLHLTGTTLSDISFPLYEGISGYTYFDGTWNMGEDVSITKFYLYPINLVDDIKTNNVNSIASFMVYPNPTQSIINVKFNEENELSFYYIYNTLGQIVKQGTFESGNYSIELSNLPQGLYVLEVKQKDQKASVKFIKND